LTELKPRIKLVLFLSFVLLVIVSNLMDCKLRMYKKHRAFVLNRKFCVY